MTNANRIDLDLSNLGNLNEEVRAMFPALVQSLPMDDTKTKARLNISIAIRRAQADSSLLALSYTLRPTFPNKAQAILARADLAGNLSVDPDDLPDRTPAFPNMEFIKED